MRNVLRRLLSFALCVFFCAFSFAAEAQEVWNGANVRFIADLSDESATAVFVSYGDGNRILDFKTYDCSAVVGENTIDVPFDFNVTGAEKVSAFLWSSINEMLPLSGKREFVILNDRFEAYYSTLEEALLQTNPAETGELAAYTDDDGVYNIVLFSDISSDETISITRGCKIVLNGYKLSFTECGTMLDIQTTENVCIDGSVEGSSIEKNCGSTNASERLINVTDARLSITGGTYNLSHSGNQECAAVCVTNQEASLVMKNCSVNVENNGGGTSEGIKLLGIAEIEQCEINISGNCVLARGVYISKNIDSADSINISDVKMLLTSSGYNNEICGISAAHHCNIDGLQIEAFSENSGFISAVRIIGDEEINAVIKNSAILAKTPHEGAHVYAVYVQSIGQTTIENCHIEADGRADIGSNAYIIAGIVSHDKYNGDLRINDCYVKASRDALNLRSSAYIDGGVYESPQHGSYFSANDIRVKNATFRNIIYDGDCGWEEGGTYYGALYIGSNATEVNVYMDGCSVECEGRANHGICVKSKNSTLYVSNTTIGDGFGTDFRCDAGNCIYVGKGVSYDSDRINNSGTFDTETYADVEFLSVPETN